MKRIIKPATKHFAAIHPGSYFGSLATQSIDWRMEKTISYSQLSYHHISFTTHIHIHPPKTNREPIEFEERKIERNSTKININRYETLTGQKKKRINAVAAAFAEWNGSKYTFVDEK